MPSSTPLTSVTVDQPTGRDVLAAEAVGVRGILVEANAPLMDVLKTQALI